MRLAVDLDLTEGRAFAYAVPAGRRSAAKRKAIADVEAALAGEPVPTRRVSVTRSDMVHLRALMALDADQAGASERDIAAQLFPSADRSDWNDSAVRANVRYLLDHGRAFRDGRYRELLSVDIGRATPPV